MLALGVARFDSVAFNSCMMSMGGRVAIAAQSPHFVIKQTDIFLLLVWVLEGISSTGQRSAPPRPEVAAAKPAAHRDMLGSEIAPTRRALAVK